MYSIRDMNIEAKKNDKVNRLTDQATYLSGHPSFGLEVTVRFVDFLHSTSYSQYHIPQRSSKHVIYSISELFMRLLTGSFE